MGTEETLRGWSAPRSNTQGGGRRTFAPVTRTVDPAGIAPEVSSDISRAVNGRRNRIGHFVSTNSEFGERERVAAGRRVDLLSHLGLF